MSTVHFGLEELGAVGAIMVGCVKGGHGTVIDLAANELTHYADANAAAVRARYPDHRPPAHTFDQREIAAAIRTALLRPSSETLGVARVTTLKMRYNLDDEATVDALHAVVSAFGALARLDARAAR